VINLSPPVDDLIRRAIDSVETLELLMLLQRSPDSYWAPEAAEQMLGIRSGTARQRFDALVAAGLARQGTDTGAFRFAPANDELGNAVSALGAAYANQRVAVINLIYSANLERLRAFSNAFRMKGDS
jgi:hypothetical protein